MRVFKLVPDDEEKEEEKKEADEEILQILDIVYHTLHLCFPIFSKSKHLFLEVPIFHKSLSKYQTKKIPSAFLKSCYNLCFLSLLRAKNPQDYP